MLVLPDRVVAVPSASGGCVAPAPVVALRDTVTTSARRHRANGEVRTFLNVTTIKPLYCLGAHVDRLAPLYRRLR